MYASMFSYKCILYIVRQIRYVVVSHVTWLEHQSTTPHLLNPVIL